MRLQLTLWLAAGLFIGILLGSYIAVVLVTQPVEEKIVLPAYERSITTQFVAIDERGGGLTANLITEIRPGTGLVLVNINDVLADINTQYSARVAAAVASNLTKIDLSNLDVIYNLKTKASIIGGQSAGTIMAVSTVAALQNKTLKNGVIATGSVNPNGEVGSAAGLIAKAQAAKNANFTTFIVPEGLGSTPASFKRTKECIMRNGQQYCSVMYVGEQISIGKDIGIAVEEVATVEEALRYFLA